jgi:hypothetical protein
MELELDSDSKEAENEIENIHKQKELEKLIRILNEVSLASEREYMW